MGLIAVDSSVLVTILNRESEREHFETILLGRQIVIGWPTVFETRIWTIRHLTGTEGYWVDQFIGTPEVRTVPFDGALESLAASAFRQFGKGRHPAKLNFGDCMAYAVAKHFEVPLLFKGNDFQLTDVTVHEGSVVAD